eukprot:8637628-Lingulodinium_polyedra.AAC.1
MKLPWRAPWTSNSLRAKPRLKTMERSFVSARSASEEAKTLLAGEVEVAVSPAAASSVAAGTSSMHASSAHAGSLS